MTEKEIILKLRKIERKLDEARKNNRLAHYNEPPLVHKKQIEFHKCQKRNRWVFGGNRSGKTECGAVEAVWRARGIHPYRKNKPTEGWVVSLTREVQRDVAQRKILSYLKKEWIADVVMVSGKSSAPEGGVIDYILVHNVFGSTSRIGFKSCESGREKFQGASLDYVWFDEEPPEDVYDECRMRVFDRKGEVFGTMTPLKGLTFVYDKIYMSDDPEVWCEFMEWADNPYLDGEEVESLTASLSEDVLESRRYGRFIKRSGLVYPEFNENVHVIDPFDVPVEWQDCLSIDPGLNNPLACLWFAVDGDGTVFVVGEHYSAGKDIDWHAEKIREKCAELKWRTDGKGRVSALIDSAANQRTLAGMRSVSELFRDRGILVNSNVNKDLFSGINTVKSYLSGAPKLYVFRNCVNLIRELKTYAWGEGERPVKKDDHCADALRYYVMSKPTGKIAPTPLTPIQMDKERLAKIALRRNSYLR
ncbi:MAG: terminase family protein [Clostridia bacterium]|nr:terminase family protein [Clostridia bacterium]